MKLSWQIMRYVFRQSEAFLMGRFSPSAVRMSDSFRENTVVTL